MTDTITTSKLEKLHQMQAVGTVIWALEWCQLAKETSFLLCECSGCRSIWSVSRTCWEQPGDYRADDPGNLHYKEVSCRNHRWPRNGRNTPKSNISTSYDFWSRKWNNTLQRGTQPLIPRQPPPLQMTDNAMIKWGKSNWFPLMRLRTGTFPIENWRNMSITKISCSPMYAPPIDSHTADSESEIQWRDDPSFFFKVPCTFMVWKCFTTVVLNWNCWKHICPHVCIGQEK